MRWQSIDTFTNDDRLVKYYYSHKHLERNMTVHHQVFIWWSYDKTRTSLKKTVMFCNSQSTINGITKRYCPLITRRKPKQLIYNDMMKRHNPPLYTIMFEHDSQSHIIQTKSDRLKRHHLPTTIQRESVRNGFINNRMKRHHPVPYSQRCKVTVYSLSFKCQSSEKTLSLSKRV